MGGPWKNVALSKDSKESSSRYSLVNFAYFLNSVNNSDNLTTYINVIFVAALIYSVTFISYLAHRILRTK